MNIPVLPAVGLEATVVAIGFRSPVVMVVKYYGLQITCRFFRTKRVRRLSNRNVAIRFSVFALPIPY